MKSTFTAEQREWLTNWLMAHCFTKAQAKESIGQARGGKMAASLEE